MINRFLPSEAVLLVVAMWIVFIIDSILPGITFDQFGVLPRKLEGLTGILVSPFLHGRLAHITSNSIPLIVLSALIRLSKGTTQMLAVLFIGGIGSGIGTWVFGTNNLVIGASGIVYAQIGFLFADAYFMPSLRSWIVAILSFVLYGGALFSLFGFLPYVSWAAHFWGLVSGVAVASLLRSPKHNERASCFS